MKTDRLLIVEDDPVSLAMLTVMLSRKYTTLGYSSSADALIALEAFEPNLLVLDVGMQLFDGLQNLYAIRARTGFEHLPAIAIVGLGHEVERQSFLAAGFQAVVTKPILEPRDLEATIDRLLKSSADSRKTNAATPGAGRGSPKTL